MASPLTGAQTFVGMRRETTRNTAETVPNIVLPINSNTLDLEKERQEDRVMMNTVDNNYDTFTTKAWVEGETKMKIDNTNLGYFLFAMFGKVTSVQQATSGAYKHTFIRLNNNGTENTTALPSYTIFSLDGQTIYKYAGCVADEGTIEIGESESTVSIKWKGIKRIKVTNGTEITNIKAAIIYTAPAKKLVFGNLVVKSATTQAGLAASTTYLNLLPGVTISVKNSVDYDWSSAATPNTYMVPFDTLAQGFEATIESSGSIIRDAVLADNFDNDTFQAYELKLDTQGAGGATMGTASGLYPMFTLTVPKALLTLEVDRPIDKVNIYKLKIENPVNDSSVGYSIQVYLQNTTASY